MSINDANGNLHSDTDGRFTEKSGTRPVGALAADPLAPPHGRLVAAPDGAPMVGVEVDSFFSEDYNAWHPAAEWVDQRMVCGEQVVRPDPSFARCDYAEVSEDGISYGHTVPGHQIVELLLGDRGEDESDAEFDARRYAVYADVNRADIADFFSTEYGAEALCDGVGDGDGGGADVEFFVPFPVGFDPAHVSLEFMGDRAESDTKLLNVRDEFEYGGAFNAKFRKHFHLPVD